MKQNRRDLARSPEASYENLLELADMFPEEVLANPVLPLMAIESPEQYAQVSRRARIARAEKRVVKGSARLDERKQRRFAADCAEHVLSLYEEHNSHDLRPRKAIEAARKFADGMISEEELQKAHDDAANAYEEARKYADYADEFEIGAQAIASAAQAAMEASALRVEEQEEEDPSLYEGWEIDQDVNTIASCAAYAAASAAARASHYAAYAAAGHRGYYETYDAYLDASLSEYEWQAECLRRYLPEAQDD